MSIIHLPIYKTEAGVHSEFPPVATFDTNATVAGVLTRKDAVEVLIKFIAGSWVIQSAWSAGTVAATMTTNPATTQTAFLYIPINDYLALASCCAQDLGGTQLVDWDEGVVDPDPPVNSVQYNLENLLAVAPFGVLIDSGLRVDWGDGIIRQYDDGVLATRAFADGTDINIILYHDDTPKKLVVGDIAGGYRGNIVLIAGDIPSDLERFEASNNLPALPALPATVKHVEINNTALDATELNTLLDFLIAGGLVNGSLSILTNPRANADLAKINTLRGRGWNVQAYGVHPNL